MQTPAAFAVRTPAAGSVGFIPTKTSRCSAHQNSAARASSSPTLIHARGFHARDLHRPASRDAACIPPQRHHGITLYYILFVFLLFSCSLPAAPLGRHRCGIVAVHRPLCRPWLLLLLSILLFPFVPSHSSYAHARALCTFCTVTLVSNRGTPSSSAPPPPCTLRTPRTACAPLPPPPLAASNPPCPTRPAPTEPRTRRRPYRNSPEPSRCSALISAIYRL